MRVMTLTLHMVNGKTMRTRLSSVLLSFLPRDRKAGTQKDPCSIRCHPSDVASSERPKHKDTTIPH